MRSSGAHYRTVAQEWHYPHKETLNIGGIARTWTATSAAKRRDSDEVQVYPVDGQEDVPVSWDGFESPNPFPELTYPCGYVITAFPTNPLEDFTSLSLALTEADGTLVPTVPSPEADYAFAPVHPLDPGVTYTACLSYTLVGGWLSDRTSATRTWRFTTLEQRFDDVSSDDPYATAIYALSKEGIVTGYPDGTFRPENLVSRQQFAKMVVKTAGSR